jgi:O-antigen/teichoic acid export membrane protein
VDQQGRPDSRGLRASVLRGFAWKTASQLVVQAASLIVGLSLARLLTPREYGVAAMVILFVNALPLLSNLALGNALIARPSLSEADRSTVFWTSLAIGAALTCAGVLASGPIAAFYGEPEVKSLFAVLACTFVIASLGSTQHALQLREMNFRAVEIRIMIATVAGAVVGLSAAVGGLGAWALILQQITNEVVGTLLLWAVSPWKPRLIYSLRSLRELGGYGGRVFSAEILFQFNRNTDSLLIGRFLGARALGAYALAATVILVPFNKIANPIQTVLFPAFSRIQDDPARIGSIWLRVNRVVAAVSVPALLGLAAVAPDFVAVVLGEKWSDATPVLQVLCWAGLLQSLQRLNPSILQAVDRTSTLLRFSVFSFVAGVGAVAVGIAWGIVGVAVCYAVVHTFTQPLYLWLTARAIGASSRAFYASIRGIFEAGLAMLAAVLFTRAILVDIGLGAGARLGILIALGAAVYLGFLVLRAPDVISEVRSLRRKRPSAAMSPGPLPGVEGGTVCS